MDTLDPIDLELEESPIQQKPVEEYSPEKGILLYPPHPYLQRLLASTRYKLTDLRESSYGEQEGVHIYQEIVRRILLEDMPRLPGRDAARKQLDTWVAQISEKKPEKTLQQIIFELTAEERDPVGMLIHQADVYAYSSICERVVQTVREVLMNTPLDPKDDVPDNANYHSGTFWRALRTIVLRPINTAAAHVSGSNKEKGI